MKDVPNPLWSGRSYFRDSGSSKSTPPRTRFCSARPPKRPCEKSDPVWVWPRCSRKGPVRAPGIPGPRPGACQPSANRESEAEPCSPYSLPQTMRPWGSVLLGPGKKDTHFRRVHDLPRLLLTLAACTGAGHRDNGTGQRSPPFLAGFRRAGKRATLSHTVSAFPALQPPRALGLPVEGRPRKDRENWDSWAP